MANIVLFNDVVNRRLITSPSSSQPAQLPPLYQYEITPFEIYNLQPLASNPSQFQFLDYTGAAAYKIGIGTPGGTPSAYTGSFAATSAPSISVTRVQAGGTGVNEQQLITINPALVYGGYASFAWNSANSPDIFYNASAPFFAPTDLQTCLAAISGIGANNINVQQVTAQSFLVTFIGTLAAAGQNLITGNGSNLLAPKGMVGSLNLGVTNVQTLLNGNPSVQTKFEIEVDLVGGSPTKTLQGNVTLYAAVIPDTSISLPDVEMLVTGSIILPSGASNGVVSGLTLASGPAKVFLSVAKNSGLLNLQGFPKKATYSTAGFSFDLNGTTDAADYELDYEIWL